MPEEQNNLKKAGHQILMILTVSALAFIIHDSSAHQNTFFLMVPLFYSAKALYWQIKKTPGSGRQAGALQLFYVTVIFFLFEYFYALNANLDYAQRFAMSRGDFSLAPDSARQQMAVFLRYAPLLAGSLAVSVKNLPYLKNRADRRVLLMALSASLLYFLALPNPLFIRGISAAGFFCYIPLFYIWRKASFKQAVQAGIFSSLTGTMLTNYWLGTFSLVSLQFISIVFFSYFLLFIPAAVFLSRRKAALISVPALFILFDWFRSAGFLGYPWGMIGTSQYAFTAFIQGASLTGVWGVSFIVLLINSGLLSLFLKRRNRTWKAFGPELAAASFAVLWLLFGIVRLSLPEPGGIESTVALIQQNTDPRKDEYRDSYNVLVKESNKAMSQKPDLIAWSETAFVPNIRRWGAMKPEQHSYAALVHDFRNYQKSLNTWLLTGNDDYSIVETDKGKRYDHFNAAVLFDNRGERKETYHKIKLVPFTESFPYKESLPMVYDFLLSWDVYLWEEGTERVIFQHPDFSFFTPICFEDGFPDHIRQFVTGGGDVIMNISNDYWSLTEVEAWQHYANGIFRAVENDRNLLRATASGVTGHVDSKGRMMGHIATYKTGFYTAEIRIPETRTFTLYTLWGDWFVWLCLFIVLVSLWVNAGGIPGKKKAAQAVPEPNSLPV